VWNDEGSKAFLNLKEFLSTPLVLMAPDPSKVLLYIAATSHLVSTVLVIERDEPGHTYKVQ
jgi:hypothetical protein